jgi:hypothetical protein
VFEHWEIDCRYPTLFRVNRMVMVDMQAALPGLGRRMDGVPMWCRGAGLRLEPFMPGHQIAWVRRFDGGFFAVVEVAAGSANGRSQLTMQLWCEPTMITTDVTGLEHFIRGSGLA